MNPNLNEDETIPLPKPEPLQIAREALQTILATCNGHETMRLIHIADVARSALKRMNSTH